MSEIENTINCICIKIQEELNNNNYSSKSVTALISSLAELVSANGQNTIINNYNDVSDK